MSHRLPLLLVLIVSLAAPAVSQVILPQSARRAGSLASISGNVRTADDRPVTDARVELHELATGEVAASGYTNVNGSFEFQNIVAGNYELVANSGMEEARERVTVQDDLNTVTLRIPRMAASSGGGDNNIVSVTELKIPEKARDENKKAQQAMHKHDVASAWKHVNKALQITPQFAAGLTTRALLELDSNKTDAAVADLEKAVQLDAGYGLSYLVLGAAYNQFQRFDDAIRTLDHGIALMPNYWPGHFELAKSYIGKNDLQNAQTQLNRCAQQAPADYAPLHLVRANLELALKNYPEAMAELEAYLEREPNGSNSEQVRKTLGEVKAFLAKK